METRTVTTSDMQFAAFIRANGYPVSSIDGPSHKRAFVFENVPVSFWLAYQQDQPVTLSPRTLFNAYFDLKRMVFMDL